MRRTAAITLMLALGLLAAPHGAEAQQAAKVYRIGLLSGAAPTAPPDFLEAFRQGLRELGYVEGQNIAIESRRAEGRLERLSDLAAELVRLKVDLILTLDTPSALAAKQATTTIPIVMLGTADPVGSGLVASLARPGGNITGLSFLGAELVAKRLELLREAVPGVTRVAVLWHPGAHGEGTQQEMLKETQVAGRALGVQLQLLEARGPNDFDRAFAAMTRERAGALMLLPSTIFSSGRKRIVGLAGQSRLPAMFYFRHFVEAGGLMSYGPSLADNYRRAATYVDKILKGAKPADLPVEQPTRFELVINLNTAKALGLTFPRSILIRADQVIQ